MDWTEPLTPAHAANTPPSDFSIANELKATVNRIATFLNPWKWNDNSCHLDCWLMVQMSLFGFITDTVDHTLNDTMILNSPPLKKLFKVLLNSGKPHQDASKMAYWIMEIEEYRGGTRGARRSFLGVGDYHIHKDEMDREMATTSALHLSTIQVGLTSTCSNPLHTHSNPMQKRKRVVSVDDYWYSLPDDWNRVLVGKGRWQMAECHQVKHTDLTDVLGSLFSRSDGETTDCKVCRENNPDTAYQVTWHKSPEYALMPLTLDFVVDPHQTVPAEDFIFFGGTNYTLVSVVFGNNVHFTCNILLRNAWYHYDGLGMPSTDNRKPRLVRMYPNGSVNHMTPPPPATGYTPIAYKYVRSVPTSLDQQTIPDVDQLPTDKQFNNMWRLMESGY